jgi:hypothetical protein
MSSVTGQKARACKRVRRWAADGVARRGFHALTARQRGFRRRRAAVQPPVLGTFPPSRTTSPRIDRCRHTAAQRREACALQRGPGRALNAASPRLRTSLPRSWTALPHRLSRAGPPACWTRKAGGASSCLTSPPVPSGSSATPTPPAPTPKTTTDAGAGQVGATGWREGLPPVRGPGASSSEPGSG